MERAELGTSRPEPARGASSDVGTAAGDAGRADVRTAEGADPGADAGPDPTRPVAVDTARIVLVGLACWAVALVVVLVVPSLHTGTRDWWPWTCVAGLVLGLLGLGYVRRGRGNAVGARRG